MSALDLHFVVLDGESGGEAYVRLDEVVAITARDEDGAHVYLRQDPEPVRVLNSPAEVVARMTDAPRQRPEAGS